MFSKFFLLSVLLVASCGDDVTRAPIDCGVQMSNITAAPVSRVGLRDGIQQKEVVIRLLEIVDNTSPGPFLFGVPQKIINPSRRLSLSYEVFFEPNAESNIVDDYQTSAWVLRAQARGVKGKEVDLHRIDPPADDTVNTERALPRSYEFDTGIRIIEAVLTLDAPADSGATIVPGWWYARAIWEPNIEICPDELEKLFSKCELRSAEEI